MFFQTARVKSKSQHCNTVDDLHLPKKHLQQIDHVITLLASSPFRNIVSHSPWQMLLCPKDRQFHNNIKPSHGEELDSLLLGKNILPCASDRHSFSSTFPVLLQKHLVLKRRSFELPLTAPVYLGEPAIAPMFELQMDLG